MSCTHSLVYRECAKCKVPVATMPLPPEVVAVLEAAGEVLASIPCLYDDNDPMVIRHAAALNALTRAWIQHVSAGRPGLPKPEEESR